MLYAIRQTTTPPSVGIAVVVAYACGHRKRASLITPTEIPAHLLRCECGGRWRWIGEDAD